MFKEGIITNALILSKSISPRIDSQSRFSVSAENNRHLREAAQQATQWPHLGNLGLTFLVVQEVAPLPVSTVAGLEKSQALLRLVFAVLRVILPELVRPVCELAFVAVRAFPLFHVLFAQLRLLLEVPFAGPWLFQRRPVISVRIVEAVQLIPLLPRVLAWIFVWQHLPIFLFNIHPI